MAKDWETKVGPRSGEVLQQERKMGPAEYREEVKKLIETEVKILIDDEIRKASQEILEEQKKAIRQLVEENRAAIRLVVEEEKKAVWSRIEELRRAALRIGMQE